MALRIEMDIEGSFITEPAFSVIDGLARQRDASEFALQNLWVAPGNLGMTLLPINLTTAWESATGKAGVSDFLLTPAKWEQVAHRTATDFFLASRGAADESVSTKAALPVNSGLFLEMFAYGVPHTVTSDVCQLKFGQFFVLHIHSTGRCDLEDLRPQNRAPGAASSFLVQGAPLAAGGGEIVGKFLQILVLPWRRGRLLFATNLGAYFEVAVGERLDGSDALKSRRTPGQAAYHVTTESAQAIVTPNPALRAFFALNALRYPLAGSLTSPALTLPYPPSQPPSAAFLDAEQQDGTRATLTLTDGAGNSFLGAPGSRPADTLRYQVALTSPASGVAPVVFQTTIDFDRQLGSRTYDSNDLDSPLSCNLSVSRERGSKSFSFTLDNPGERWTSLKDLWNRKMRAYLEVDDVDPAMTEIFSGYTQPAEFVDGRASKLTIGCSGLRQALRSQLLSDSFSPDGMVHSDAVRRLLHEGGVADDQMVIQDDPGVTLESAEPGEDSIWRPSNGQSRDDFIDHLAKTFSGWVYDDIGGKFYYCSREFLTAAALADMDSIPVVHMTTPTDPITHAPTSRRPNGATMVALRESVRQTAEEPRANDFWILGRDGKSGKIIAVHYEDSDSITTRTAPNYVGERRVFIYASAAITSEWMAMQTLDVIVRRLANPVKTVAFALPDYQWPYLPLEGLVNIQNYGLGLITGCDADMSRDRLRRTEYTAELLQ